jgi:hypothetical protein
MTRPRPAPQAPPKRLWPQRDYYRTLLPDDRERVHPLDRLIDHDPAVRRAHERARRLEKKVRLMPGAEAAFREYIDARFDLLVKHATMAFNIGVEVGTVAARAEEAALVESGGASPEDLNAFRLSVRGLLLGANIPAAERLLAFLEAAYALGRGAIALQPVRDVVRLRRSEERREGGGARRRGTRKRRRD